MKKTKLIVLLCIFTTATSSLFAASRFPARFDWFSLNPFNARDPEIEESLSKVEDLFKFSKQQYLYDIDYDKASEAMAEALIASLDDPYSVYVPHEEAQNYGETLQGTYGGIGIYLFKYPIPLQDYKDEKTLFVNVRGCFPQGPAERAGLVAGDIITKIDDKEVVSLSALECSKMMKGEPGTTVKLTIKRGGVPIDVSIKREKINVPTVQSMKFDNGIAYLKINEFSTKTFEQFKTNISELHPTDKGLIIDLRNNSGGNVEVCVSIADYFLSGKPIVNVEYKNHENDSTFTANRGVGVSDKVPVVVLCNNGSASASEILIGALKDNGRATIIGSKTYGKGVMQLTTPFGTGWVTLTIAEYTTPSGYHVHKQGITPDIEIPQIIEPNDENAKILEQYYKDNPHVAFVDANPNYSDSNVDRFISENTQKYNLPRDVLASFVLSEYYQRMDSQKRPIANPKYDQVLTRAIQFLTEGK